MAADTNQGLSMVEQALVDGALTFVNEHPELLQKVITIGLSLLANRVMAWLADLEAQAKIAAGTAGVVGSPAAVIGSVGGGLPRG